MGYRQATVDFTGLHVACLSGDNGAGKSTLLDAITWARATRARRVLEQLAQRLFLTSRQDTLY